jgi:predicted permease
MIDVLPTLVPIFALIGVGMLIRRVGLISSETVQDFKKIIVSVALPAVFFVAFLSADLSATYAALILMVFVINLLLYGIGVVAKGAFPSVKGAFPFVMTGFEFGMMAPVFFGTAFGMENFAYIAVIGLGHELFIWFVYVTLMKRYAEEQAGLAQTLRSFATSPIIIAIVLSIILNLTGLGDRFLGLAWSTAVTDTLGYLGNLVIPLILLILGYELRLTGATIRGAIGPVLFRLSVTIAVAVVFARFILGPVLGLDGLYVPALYTFFLLPPPFILAIYLPERDRERVNGIVVAYSLASIAAFSVFFILWAG